MGDETSRRLISLPSRSSAPAARLLVMHHLISAPRISSIPEA